MGKGREGGRVWGGRREIGGERGVRKEWRGDRDGEWKEKVLETQLLSEICNNYVCVSVFM